MRGGDFVEENGVWRTVGGRRIFIKEGQDLASAMKESGKFKSKNIKNSDNKESERKSKIEKSKFENYNNIDLKSILRNKKNIFLSAIVFCCYSLGVFVAFYFALIFHEYRTTLSQMSGVINGLATVLLTFIIEPKLAKSFDDKNPEAINLLFSVLLGRFIGVSIFSPLIIFILYIWN